MVSVGIPLFGIVRFALSAPLVRQQHIVIFGRDAEGRPGRGSGRAAAGAGARACPCRWDSGRPHVVRYRGRTRHSGQALRRYADRQAIERSTEDGRLVTADQAAELLGIRLCDVDHLIRIGWLQAAAWVHSSHHRRSTDPTATDQTVPLYQTADLDALLGHPAFDWEEIRATPHGRPSDG